MIISSAQQNIKCIFKTTYYINEEYFRIYWVNVWEISCFNTIVALLLLYYVKWSNT